MSLRADCSTLRRVLMSGRRSVRSLHGIVIERDRDGTGPDDTITIRVSAMSAYHFILTVITDHEHNSGTDADVEVVIGWITADGRESSSTKRHTLDNPGNDFEHDNVDVYDLDDEFAPGANLKWIRVKCSGSDGWKLAELRVTVDDRTWWASPNRWLLNEGAEFALEPFWMSGLDDQLTIDQINIPGTHDSGTWLLNRSNYSNTQDRSLLEQLYLGIRYFDIRLKFQGEMLPSGLPKTQIVHQNGVWICQSCVNFSIHHANDWCYLYFDHNSWVPAENAPEGSQPCRGWILQDLLLFLDKNPREFVLMQIQQESSKESKDIFTNTFDIIRLKYNDRFLITSKYPTVGAARGKIVLVTNGSSIVKGLSLYDENFAHKDAYTVYDEKLVDGPKNNPVLYFENHWMDTSDSVKWNNVEKALNTALQATPGRWVVTYVSDGSGAKHPREFATNLNAQVINFIRENGLTKSYGTVVCDFPTPQLVAAILARHAPHRGAG
jgi:1-phosphatidylinositol phosphodiesterase